MTDRTAAQYTPRARLNASRTNRGENRTGLPRLSGLFFACKHRQGPWPPVRRGEGSNPLNIEPGATGATDKRPSAPRFVWSGTGLPIMKQGTSHCGRWAARKRWGPAGTPRRRSPRSGATSSQGKRTHAGHARTRLIGRPPPVAGGYFDQPAAGSRWAGGSRPGAGQRSRGAKGFGISGRPGCRLQDAASEKMNLVGAQRPGDARPLRTSVLAAARISGEASPLARHRDGPWRA